MLPVSDGLFRRRSRDGVSAVSRNRLGVALLINIHSRGGDSA